jgi:membrane-bound serine protease (ClpP class)
MELVGPIDRFQAVYVQRTVDRARREGASRIIVDIDTFGGRVDSALQIANALGTSVVPTTTWVRQRPAGTGVSWSAGALIALATQEIYMAPGTSIGAAAPVLQGPGGAAEGADEKTVSAIRGQISALAEQNGHSPVIARAMVDPSLEAYRVLVDGEARIVDGDGLEQLQGQAERDEITLVMERRISAAGSLLTLTAGEMVELEIAVASPATREELADYLGVAISRFVNVTPGRADQAVGFLTGGGFTTLLILIGLIAIGLEVSSPGFGLPGATAIAAFGAVFAANMLLGNVGSMELILFVAGIILLVFEIFVIPGFGVAGVSGLAAMAAGLILSLQDFTVPDYSWQWDILGRNALIVFGAMALALVAAAALMAVLPRNRFFFHRLALQTQQDTAAGFTVQPTVTTNALLGQRGIVRSDLRPVGTVELSNDQREVLTVESEGGFIARGQEITIIRADGNRVVVREA